MFLLQCRECGHLFECIDEYTATAEEESFRELRQRTRTCHKCQHLYVSKTRFPCKCKSYLLYRIRDEHERFCDICGKGCKEYYTCLNLKHCNTILCSPHT